MVAGKKKKNGNMASGKGDISICTLSFTFEGNCGINLKALLKCMNRQYFFSFKTKIKNEKVKFKNLIFFIFGVWLHDLPKNLFILNKKNYIH